jgi:F-type H+-transporting ATPase subunit b
MLGYAAQFLATDAPAEEPPNPIIPIWEEIVVGSVAFAVLAFVLMKFVFPRMEEMYKARVEAIEGGIKRAEERQAEANALFEQYKLKLAEARSEAARIRDEARADAEGIRADVLAKAREESDRIIAAGKDGGAKRRTIVRVACRVGTLAVGGQQIVGSRSPTRRQRGTVERFSATLAPQGRGRA